jgi:hypothetical protein
MPGFKFSSLRKTFELCERRHKAEKRKATKSSRKNRDASTKPSGTSEEVPGKFPGRFPEGSLEVPEHEGDSDLWQIIAD